MENRHYLHTPEEIDEALDDPKAHWHNLEDKKVGERKRCMVNLARLCVVENLPLHIGSWPGFLKFMRKWEP